MRAFPSGVSTKIHELTQSYQVFRAPYPTPIQPPDVGWTISLMVYRVVNRDTWVVFQTAEVWLKWEKRETSATILRG